MRTLMQAASSPTLRHQPVNTHSPSLFQSDSRWSDLLPKTYAKYPVWQGSVAKDQKGKALSISQKRALSKAARIMLTQKRRDDKTGRARSVLGAAALAVFDAMLWQFHNSNTGRLDPSYDGIAAATGLSRATVARQLKKLAGLGLIHWVRRCEAVVKDGVFQLVQLTNSYCINATSMWRGFAGGLLFPHKTAVLPHEWGAAPVMPSCVESAAEALASGDMRNAARAFAQEPKQDHYSRVMARICGGLAS